MSLSGESHLVSRAGSEENAERPSLPAATRVGRVELTVTDLDRSIAFYEQSVGLRLHRRDDPVAALGAGAEDLVILVEDGSARPAGRHAGLYHFALLHPSRVELACAAVRLATTRTPIQGASDHGTHEAIYLPDPDGNGVELAADRPRDVWPDLRQAHGPDPLDLRGLLELAGSEQPRPHADPGLTVGHVHLHVNELEPVTRFYRDLVGLDTTMVFPTAVFVSAGGYHHHVGFNTWRGERIPPAPRDGVVGLRRFTLLVPGRADVDAIRRRLDDADLDYQAESDGLLVHDPSGNALLLVTAEATDARTVSGDRALAAGRTRT
jgi:catechol 2,3-dioxygenase